LKTTGHIFKTPFGVRDTVLLKHGRTPRTRNQISIHAKLITSESNIKSRHIQQTQGVS